MMQYTKSHEWIEAHGDHYRVGITDWAQSELGEIVYIELPKTGTQLKRDDVLCVIETTKAAADIYCPFDGTVIAVNEALIEEPGLINMRALTEGWIAELDGEPTGLLETSDYRMLTGV